MLHEISFRSTNGRDSVQAWIYVPAAKPQGIIQLVHGFGEHSRRYLHMIVKFMEAGFIVAADDHVGHGKTALVNNCWGDWGDKGPHTMMEDEHVFMTGVKQMFPDLPYFMFGHSMGSMIARDFMTKYGDELDGVTLCGTPGEFPGLEDSIAYLKALVDDGKGLEADPEAGNVVMGWMFGRCEEGVTLGNEWICHDPYVQKDHAEDPFDAFTKPTSNRSFLDFCYMMEQITGPAWAEKVPADLPVYNIGGDQDPVGQYGEGFYKVSNWLIDNGNEVTTELFTGYRHEIHNYAELKDEVEDGIIAFFEGCIDLPEELLELLMEEGDEAEDPNIVAEIADEAEETPAEEPAVEEDPAEEPAVEEVPAEEPAVEEIPAEEPAVEEVPAEEAPIEEVSAEEPEEEEIPAVIPVAAAAGAVEAVAEDVAPEAPAFPEFSPAPEAPAEEAPAEPEIELPEMPAMPEMPAAPEEMFAAAPEPVVPEIQVEPEVAMPEIDIPAAPEVPQVEIPAAPEIPEIEVPQVDIPQVDIPQVDIPQVDIPQVEIPGIPEIDILAAPEVPGIEVPEIPAMPEFKLPEMNDVPEVPGVPEMPAMPEFKLPDMNDVPEVPGAGQIYKESEETLAAAQEKAEEALEQVKEEPVKESIFRNLFHRG